LRRRCCEFLRLPGLAREKNQAREAYYVFFGLRSDVEVAHYLTDLMDTTVRSELGRYKTTPEYRRFGHKERHMANASFALGMVASIADKLTTMKVGRDQASTPAASTRANDQIGRLVIPRRRLHRTHLELRPREITRQQAANHPVQDRQFATMRWPRRAGTRAALPTLVPNPPTGRPSVRRLRFRLLAVRMPAQREWSLRAWHHRPVFFLVFDFVFAGVAGFFVSCCRCSFRANFASRIARS
jgi:hypothetical protein